MSNIIKKEIRQIKKNCIIIALIWTFLIGISITWNIYYDNNNIKKNALIHARATVDKDILFRRWISLRNGVYVELSDITKPNIYLKVPHRDIQTTKGKKLTLINPALMTRQVHQLQTKTSEIISHITSLTPINPVNRADKWETDALKEFKKNKNKKEISKICLIENKEYLRLIVPLKIEQSCLYCHAKQGYKIGDTRGGISANIPTKQLKTLSREHLKITSLGHLLIWIFIISVLIFITLSIIKKTKFRLKMQNHLEQKESIIDSSSNAIIVTELSGLMTYANNAFFNMWHITDQIRIFDKTIQSLLKVDNDDREEILSTIKDLGSWIGELIAIRPDNSEFNVLISASLISNKNKGINEIAFSFSDITMRKNSEYLCKKNEKSLRKRNNIIERDLKIAKIATKELITGEIPKSNFLTAKYRYLPMEDIGGDYFSFSHPKNDCFCVFIGDISGHGVASALFLALIKSVLGKLKENYLKKPEKLLTAMSRELYGNMSSYFITGLYGVFEPSKNGESVNFSYANGGHIDPLIIRANNNSEFLTKKETIIGISEDLTYNKYSIELFKGDRIFLYTDGIPETENTKKEMIGFDDELIKLFNKSKSPKLEDTLDNIIIEINNFRGNRPIKDDIILIGIEIK
jgi:PAS domain S-box-containing protein